MQNKIKSLLTSLLESYAYKTDKTAKPYEIICIGEKAHPRGVGQNHPRLDGISELITTRPPRTPRGVYLNPLPLTVVS